ncbi:single-stranded DNA-binding protein [Patescibacteria group bacterium]|nr:single-stranded DNA-binding protein [Patescibacteria group bacterium]
MDLNKVMVIGRLTRDPESRTTPQGIAVTNFGLATNRVWKDKEGNQQDNTEFHNIVAWRRLGEICAQYLAKGRQVYIEGHLQTRSWEDQDGKKNYRTEIVADNMIMLGSKADNIGQAPTPSPAARIDTQAATPASQESKPQDSKPEEGEPTGPVKDEEIKIEDIPF